MSESETNRAAVAKVPETQNSQRDHSSTSSPDTCGESWSKGSNKMRERFEGSETAPENDFESRTGVLHSKSGN